MKRYNRGNHQMILLGMVIPILAFFVSMNIVFAFFTANTRSLSFPTSIATLKIKIEDDGFYSQTETITESSLFLSGNTISAKGTIVNESSVPVYVIVGVKLTLTQPSSSTPYVVKESFFTINNNNLVEIHNINGTYSATAFLLEEKNQQGTNYYLQDYTLSHSFDVNEYGNSYSGATVTYEVSAFAIQQAGLTNANEATDELISLANNLDS